MDEVEKIAAGLSEAQRQHLIRARQDHLDGHYRTYGQGIVRRALRTRGLGWGDFCYLTPLGLAVRDHLRAQEKGDDP